MKRFAPLGLAAALALGPSAANAADPAAAPAAPAPAAAQARAADVATVDGIIAALYDVISGPAGAPRDWNRMRSLFAPDAHLMAVGMNKEGAIVTRSMTVDDYIKRNSPAFAKIAFFEKEAARTGETFGQVAQVFSTYESRHAPGDKPFQRGINSIQLYNDGARWYIANLVWRGEDSKLQLPERYLHNN